jgi:hypothetical protein
MCAQAAQAYARPWRTGDRHLPCRPLLLLDDLATETDALLTDVDARPSDQLACFALRLPTERAAQRAIDPLRGWGAPEHEPSVFPFEANSHAAHRLALFPGGDCHLAGSLVCGRGQVPVAATVAATTAGTKTILCVPKTSSTSCGQAIFVVRATGGSVSSGAVPLKIDRFGQRFQRRGCVQGAVRPGADCDGSRIRAASAAHRPGSRRGCGPGPRAGIPDPAFGDPQRTAPRPGSRRVHRARQPRPAHRSRDLRPPYASAVGPSLPAAAQRIRRRDRLGGLIHEYEPAAA